MKFNLLSIVHSFDRSKAMNIDENSPTVFCKFQGLFFFFFFFLGFHHANYIGISIFIFQYFIL